MDINKVKSKPYWFGYYEYEGKKALMIFEEFSTEGN